MMTNDDWQTRYVSLAQRLEALDRENRALRAQLVIAEGRDHAGARDRIMQAGIVQSELTKLNAQLQEEREEIQRLRARLRELGDAD